jgi:hypothetical protein
VAALDAERFDVGAGGFGDSQAVQREQGNECMFRRWPESRRD